MMSIKLMSNGCEQVTRSKNKWKCTLKDGIMHLNNRDILFVKVNCNPDCCCKMDAYLLYVYELASKIH